MWCPCYASVGFLTTAATVEIYIVCVCTALTNTLCCLWQTPLSLSVLSKNMVVFITIGAFLGMTALLVLYGYWKVGGSVDHATTHYRLSL